MRLNVEERSLEEVWFMEAHGSAAHNPRRVWGQQGEFNFHKLRKHIRNWAGSHTSSHMILDVAAVTTGPNGKPGGIWYRVGNEVDSSNHGEHRVILSRNEWAGSPGSLTAHCFHRLLGGQSQSYTPQGLWWNDQEVWGKKSSPSCSSNGFLGKTLCKL